MEVQPKSGPGAGVTVDLSGVEVRALFNILSLVATGVVQTEKPEREMAARMRAELETALDE